MWVLVGLVFMFSFLDCASQCCVTESDDCGGLASIMTFKPLGAGITHLSYGQMQA